MNPITCRLFLFFFVVILVVWAFVDSIVVNSSCMCALPMISILRLCLQYKVWFVLGNDEFDLSL